MITFDDIQRANAQLTTTDIKGKAYTEVNQRIKAFRMLYPEGTIKTTLISDEGGRCIMQAEVYDGDLLLATGTAYEREQSSYINKTSYIENCETSAVGRALGMLGIGIDTSVASKEEVENAIAEQERLKNRTDAERMMDAYPPREEMVQYILMHTDGENLRKMLEWAHVDRVEDMDDVKLITAYNRKTQK